jgi:hypothetical protein
MPLTVSEFYGFSQIAVVPGPLTSFYWFPSKQEKIA